MEEKLGRGLSALLGDLEAGNPPANIISNKIDIDLIIANKNQPRKEFDEDKLRELAESISLHGVLQPLAVRKKDDHYELIAGERRLRASKMAGLREVPVYIVDCKDSEIMALALIENLQRTDLNPIEEAEALRNLLNTADCRQEDLGILVSKSRSYITNALRLLSLPEKVRGLVKDGKLSAGHARALVGIGNAEEIAGMASRENWSVRQLEGALKDLKSGTVSVPKTEEIGSRPAVTNVGTPIDLNADPEAMDIAIRVAEALKVETKLKITKKGGVFTLVCKSCEELEELVEKLISLGE